MTAAGTTSTDERGERLGSLILELYELEEQSYRLALLDAKGAESKHEQSAALRAVVGHIGEMLEELHALARARHLRLGSLPAIVADAFLRVRDAVEGSRAREDAAERSEESLRRGIEIARRLRAAASEEGDDDLARWSDAWLQARLRLVGESVRVGPLPPTTRSFTFGTGTLAPASVR